MENRIPHSESAEKTLTQVRTELREPTNDIEVPGAQQQWQKVITHGGLKKKGNECHLSSRELEPCRRGYLAGAIGQRHSSTAYALKQSSWGRWGRNRKRRRNLVLKVNLVSVNNSSANY